MLDSGLTMLDGEVVDDKVTDYQVDRLNVDDRICDVLGLV